MRREMVLRLTLKRAGVVVGIVLLLTLLGLYLWYRNAGTFAETELYSNVEIVERTRTIDLTEWVRDPNPNDSNYTDKAIYDDDLILRRLREDVTVFALPLATSGASEPSLTSKTHPVTLVRAFHKRPGWPQVSEYNAILDISKEAVDKPFKAHLRSVRLGGFSDPNVNWVGTSVLHPISKLTVIVKFPKDKPALKLRYRVAFFFRGTNFAVPDIEPQVALPAYEVRWEIDHPVLGYAYKIEWDW